MGNFTLLNTVVALSSQKKSTVDHYSLRFLLGSRQLKTFLVFVKRGEEQNEEEGEMAVSYTHLTLPTICSV